MAAAGPVGFRPPLTSVLPVAVVLVALALAFPTLGSGMFVVVFVVGITALRLRQLLVLHDDHLEVTVLGRRRIPWAQIQGFDAGGWLRGGTQIQTTSGVVHSVAPCSWWGGPAEEADLEALRRELRART